MFGFQAIGLPNTDQIFPQFSCGITTRKLEYCSGEQSPTAKHLPLGVFASNGIIE